MKYAKLLTIISFGFIGCKNIDKNEKTAGESLPHEHAVIIHFKYGIQGLDSLFKLEDKLEQTLEDKNVGEYDGHEIAVDYSDGYLYLYGKNADDLFNTIKPTLQSSKFMKNAEATLRYGNVESNAKENVVKIQ